MKKHLKHLSFYLKKYNFTLSVSHGDSLLETKKADFSKKTNLKKKVSSEKTKTFVFNLNGPRKRVLVF